MTAATFRAVWPITDQTVPWHELIRQAALEVPRLAAQAKADVNLRAGRFSIAPSADIPGSGRITETCLLYEAPARPIPPRAYHRRSAAA